MAELHTWKTNKQLLTVIAKYLLIKDHKTSIACGQLEKQGTGNRTGTGTGLRETKICAKLLGLRQLVALGYCLHESQGRIDLRTHGSLTLFMRRTRKNCGGEGTTINSIVVRVKYPFSSHYS